MSFSKLTSPFLTNNKRVSGHMLVLLYALVPAVIAQVFYFGYGVIVTLIIAVVSALIAEAIMLKLRNRPIKPFITDGSAIVTAVLLAISIPPLSPYWLTILGIIFAIVFAKHLYGGLGYNPFNPAMVAYVMLLISFPVEMTRWLASFELSSHVIDFTSALQLIFTGHLTGGIHIDAVSGATPLDFMKTQLSQAHTTHSILQQPLFDGFTAKSWLWTNIWFAIGGLFLLFRRIISWHIPVAMLSAITLLSGLTWLISPESYASPLFHLFSGGTMLGAFFIATDPVTASTTVKGRIVFGAGVGILTYIIRTWGGYPDGIAFAVLLMNMLVPLIDYYTQPRIYGSRQ